MSFRSIISATLWLLAAGCNIHSSDRTITDRFYSHRAEFERLLTMMREDDQIISILPAFIVTRKATVKNTSGTASLATEAVLVGLPIERLTEYRKLLYALNPGASILRGDDGSVAFRLEGGNLLPLSDKGVVYSSKPLASCKSELADCMPSHHFGDDSQAAVVYKEIESHWYLYLAGV